MESPEGRVYPSGTIEKIRNALDDYVDGWMKNIPDKMANAKEHLSIAGTEVLELILLGKIEELDKIGRKLNSFFWKLCYPRKVYNYIYREQIPINEKMQEGKKYKSSDYGRAKNAFLEGIELADEIINSYEMWEIEGMRGAEHRILYLATTIITAIVTFVVTIGVTILLKILKI